MTEIFNTDEKKSNMYNRIINNNNAIIKLQERSENELNESEKLKYLDEVFERNKAKFLEKYFSYLIADDVCLFENSGDYVVAYYLKKICEPMHKRKALVKNRRYEALQRLIRQGEYFDNESMKSREPLLYEQMVGKYEKNDELNPNATGTGLHLTDFLMKHLESVNHSDRISKLEGLEKDQTEEEEEDEEEDDDDDDEEEEDEEEISERDQMKNEFISIMHRKFLNGENLDIDYHAIDFNDDYDNIEIESRDQEEKYFDENDDDDDDDDLELSSKTNNQEYDY